MKRPPLTPCVSKKDDAPNHFVKELPAQSVGRRLALSLVGQLHGCVAGYAFFAIYQLASSGRIYNMNAMLFWPTIFALFGWLLFVAPIVIFVPQTHSLFRVTTYPLFGAIYGIVVFCLAVGSWSGFWRSIPFLVWPGVIGAVSGMFYSAAITKRVFEGRSSLVLFGSPFVLPVFVGLIAWPSMEKLNPYWAYRYGNPHSHSKMQVEIIKSIKVGDRLQDLHNRYPKLFLNPRELASKDNDYAGSTGGAIGDFEYAITFYRGEVQKVVINGSKRPEQR